MAQAIELIGVSGVGKTAIYRRVRWQRYRLKRACTYKQVECRAAAMIGVRGTRLLRWMECQARAAFPAALQNAAAERFITTHPEFARSVWAMIADSAGGHPGSAARAYRGARLFYKSFAQHQMISEYDQRAHVLLNEGLVQRFRGYRCGTADRLDEAVAGYLGELIRGVVLLTAPVDVVEARLVARSGGVERECGCSRERRLARIARGVRDYRNIVARLQRDGVPCWEVDASGTVDATARRVMDILAGL